MAIYCVGDVQGCYDELRRLLDLARFDPADDELWLTGDLVARGPKSLEVLRFVHSLGFQATTVLGNHDLHLLATAAGYTKPKKKDRLDTLLEAHDADKLLRWLRLQPLLAEHPTEPLIMCHAGISPQWSIETAKRCAHEVEDLLRSDQGNWLLLHMYGNDPAHWDERLTGLPRWRYIINVFTRMRFCSIDGSLDFHSKVSPKQEVDGLKPWFELRQPQENEPDLVFGHWAALMGQCPKPRIHALDTGCVWGNQLTMWRWDDDAIFSLGCPMYAKGD